MHYGVIILYFMFVTATTLKDHVQLLINELPSSADYVTVPIQKWLSFYIDWIMLLNEIRITKGRKFLYLLFIMCVKRKIQLQYIYTINWTLAVSYENMSQKIVTIFTVVLV